MIEIIHQDDDILAVNKPSGIKVHRGVYDSRRERFVLQRVRDQVGRHLYPVHRLDRPTSGVLVFALNPGAARSLAKSFARRQVHKTYVAVVRGYIAEAGQVDHPLDRSAHEQPLDKAPQPALTRYLRLDAVELPVAVGRYATARYSLVRAAPATGRMHQIRRHMAHLDHPIVNDRQYGDNKHNRFFSEELHCRRLLLAATEICFAHPRSREPTRLTARLDADFGSVLKRLGWEQAVPRAWRFRPPAGA
ncbi:MAG: pseudouridine synthase [Desulfobacterales bacterium]|jgi:tRNA pseudouridine65 synthase